MLGQDNLVNMRIALWLYVTAALMAACHAQFNSDPQIPLMLTTPAKDHEEGLAVESFDYDYDTMEKSGPAIWDATLERIKNEYPDLRPDLLVLLLAQFPTDFVPDEIMRLASLELTSLVGEERGSRDSLPDWFGKIFTGKEEGHQDFCYHQCRDVLIQYGILQKTKKENLTGVRIHRSIQSHARNLGDTLQLRRWHLRIVLAAGMQLGDRRDQAISHKKILKHLPDLSTESLMELNLGDAGMSDALHRVARIHQKGLQLSESRDPAERALQWGQIAFPSNDLRIIDCMETVSIAYLMANDQESERLQGIVFQTRRDVLGEAHPDTLRALRRQAHSYFWWGQWPKALELRAQELSINRNAHGESDDRTLSNMGDLAMVQYSSGQFDKAQEVRTQLVTLLEAKYGADDERTLASMGRLGVIHRAQGNLERAQELQTQVVATREKTLGSEHTQTLRDIAELAALHRSRGQYEAAKELQVSLVAILNRLHGETAETTLTQAADLAVTYALDENIDEAQKLLIGVIEATRATGSGKERPNTKLIHKLAEMYMKEERSKEAEALLVQANQTVRTLSGDQPDDDLESIALLARNCMAQHRFGEAEDLLTGAWERRSNSSRKHSEFVWHIIMPLRTLYKVHGPQNKLEMPTLELLRFQGAIDYDQMQTNYNHMEKLADLADIYMEQRRWHDAEQVLRPLLNNRRARYGVSDVRTLLRLQQLAIVEWNQGRWVRGVRVAARFCWNARSSGNKILTVVYSSLFIGGGTVVDLVRQRGTPAPQRLTRLYVFLFLEFGLCLVVFSFEFFKTCMYVFRF